MNNQGTDNIHSFNLEAFKNATIEDLYNEALYLNQRSKLSNTELNKIEEAIAQISTVLNKNNPEHFLVRQARLKALLHNL